MSVQPGEAVVLEFLRHLPLISAIAWFSIATLQVYRDRYHTWTETFFLFACFFAGLYAIGDWMFFIAADESRALFAALVSMSSITLTSLFLLLFTLVYVDKLRRAYWLLAMVSGGVLILIPSGMITDVFRPGPETLFVPKFNTALFGLFLIYVIAYAIGGIANLFRLYRIVRPQSEQLARRARGLVATFVLVLVLGLLTNGYLGITENAEIPPPFSTLLVFVAFALTLVLYPGTRSRISDVVQRFKATRYDIKAAFLIFSDGTLIGSRLKAGENIVDQDLFSATLDVIQNFMRTSFPFLRGKWLRSIAHGDYTIIMERGRHVYMTVVIEGEETDLLRRQMRDLLLAFEGRNRDVLANWRGVPEDARGTEETLGPLVHDTGAQPGFWEGAAARP